MPLKGPAPLTQTADDDAARRGRRAATTLYWLAIGFIVVVGFRSIVPAVFWPGGYDASVDQAAMGAVACKQEIERLRSELVVHTTTHIALVDRLGDESASAARESGDFFGAWDRDWAALSRGCDQEAIGTLERLRYQLQTTLQRYDRQEGRLLERMHRQLDAVR